ncbi:ATPase AAA [Fibrobacteres bacterium R8-0-B4]
MANENKASKRLLPVGIQSFSDIRERGFVYVDKTARAYELITGSGKAFFLSRPRRFGKSLLCSTFGAVFEGRRELFGEIAGRGALAIDSLDWEWRRHPVIRIDLNAGNYADDGVKALRSTLYAEMRRLAGKYGVAIDRADTPDSQFKYLIESVCDKTGEMAAVIIDEYDSPLTNTLDKRDIHIELRNALKAFYGVLKSYDDRLRFIFITGVSKFSQVSVFSGLNQITDMTFDPRYADICGLTQEEVEADFEPEIESVLQNTGAKRADYIGRLRRFYNGYRFTKDPLTVYNPFGLLNHFYSNGEFADYWYRSATPSFLVELLNQQKVQIHDLGNMRVGYSDFERFDIDHIAPAPLLYQTGYLTITGYDEERRVFTLDYPNEEVYASFADSLLKHGLGIPPENAAALHVKLIDAVYDGDVDAVLNAIKVFLGGIPYDVIPPEKEAYFQAAVHLIFKMLGFDCRPEVRIADGRIDAVVETKKFVYCFEFKLDGSAEEALAQIDTKEYAFPWTGSGKKVFKVGVNFDFEKRNIDRWVSIVG